MDNETPVRGKYGEPRKYRVEDCPHEPMKDDEDSDGYQSYFCPDCGLRQEGDCG